MFDTGRRLRALEARVTQLELDTERKLDKLAQLVDSPELERMRGSVLNALRALRRSQSAEEARAGNGQSPGKGDNVDRLLAVRRGSHGLL